MLRVLIADDHPILRQGLAELLRREFKGVVCGEAGDAEQTLAQIKSHRWNLVILDISMPGRSGIDVLADLKRILPNLPVLILSASPEDQYAKRLLKAGASGYLGKDSVTEELSHAVRKLLAGGLYISAVLAEKLAMELRQDSGRPLHETLSTRELEVLRMMASGNTASQIAGQLSISATTVSTYRARILEKLSLTSTAELISYALRNQLVD
jgi:DNA-binding NarL/FixJ family response regulator